MIFLKIFVLSKSETAKFFDRLTSVWPQNVIPKVKNLKVYEIDRDNWLLSGDKIIAAQVDGLIVPFLGEQEYLRQFPSVTIDRGAVKFVCNCANVIGRGIVDFGSFK